MMRKLIINIFILGACLTGLGGATCQSQNPEFQLPERARIFNSSLRWHRFDDAAKCVLPKDRGHFLQRQKQRARMIRYIDFEIIGIHNVGPELAEVQVSLQSQRQSSTIIAADVVRQTWEKAGSTWYVTKIEIIKEPSPEEKINEKSFGLD
jgi:hypothetical protein